MKSIVASLVIAAAIIFGAVIIVNKSPDSSDSSGSSGKVTNESGKQIITIAVRGGYSPRVSNAKANVATIIRFVTNGTFDCSSAVSIPALGYRTNLPQSGTTDVEIPPQASGSSIQGTCGMGMYYFSINFN